MQDQSRQLYDKVISVKIRQRCYILNSKTRPNPEDAIELEVLDSMVVAEVDVALHILDARIEEGNVTGRAIKNGITEKGSATVDGPSVDVDLGYQQ